MDYLQNVMGYFNQQQPLCAQHDKISKDLYQEYGVKAGLRDENGKGVLAGLFVILLCVLFVAFFDSLGYVVVGITQEVEVVRRRRKAMRSRPRKPLHHRSRASLLRSSVSASA